MTFPFANREVCDLTVCDYATQRPIHVIDYANATSNELTGETVYAYGGQGHPRRVAFHGDKGGTLAVETQMMTSELFAIATGAEVSNEAKFIKRLELTAETGSITVPEGTTLVEGSLTVYEADDDMGTPVEATLAGSTITLGGDNESSSGAFIVYGIENITSGVKKLSIKAKTFPKDVTIYGETLMRGEDGVDYAYKLIVYKASPQPNMTFGFSNNGDPVSITITFDIMADKDDNMMDMILLNDE